METGTIRQGDVLLVPVDNAPPKHATPLDIVILAEGELTGHAHRLRGTVVEWSVGEQRYVRVVGDEPGTLQHEDHDPVAVSVVVPEQTYRVVPQQEWDLSGMWRKVAD